MNKTYKLKEAQFDFVKKSGNVIISGNKSLYLHFHGAGTILIILMMLLTSIHAYPQGVYKMDPYLNYTNVCVLKINGKPYTSGIAALEYSAVASAARALLMFNKHGFDYKEIVKTAPGYMPRMGKPNPDPVKTTTTMLKVYPNPCRDYISLEYRTGNKYNTLWVELTDATGKTVLNQKLKGGDNDELLGIAELKPGVYFVRLIGDNSLVDIQRITVLR